MLVQEPIQAAIWHCLNHYAYSDAIFLAERLNAELKSEDSLFLLATCYYRANKRNQCYSILKEKLDLEELNPRCRYLLALCCVELNKLSEAETILTGCHHEFYKPNEKGTVLDKVVDAFGDTAPFACQLLGRINQQAGRTGEAYYAYLRSLKLNPFLWDSFESICRTGESIDPEDVFRTSHLQSFSMCHGTQTVISLVGNENQEPVVMGVCNRNLIDIQPKCENSLPLSVVVTTRPTPKPIPPPIVDEQSILHPTNKNRPMKSGRMLFTSTPVAFNKSTFGCIPLDSSTESMENNSTMSPFIMLSPAPTETSEPRPKKLLKRILSTCPPPAGSCQGFRGNVLCPYHELNFFQPCLRVPPSWQQTQQTATSVLSAHTPSPTHQTPPQQPLNTQMSNVRRSSRLFSNSTNNLSVKENSKTPARATPSKSPNRKNKLRGSKTTTVSSNNNSTYQENQKNSQHLEGDITPVIESNGGAGDYKYFTPPCGDKMVTILSVTNVMGGCIGSGDGGNIGLNTSAMAQTALTLQKQSAEGLMSLLCQLGIAYVHLSRYECEEAIICLSKLTTHHQESGWVLATRAKAFFEMGNYDEAIRTYGKMRKLEPSRVAGLEWLSTALWHVQQEIELSTLAHDLISLERHHPVTWIAVGNCFSLNKEHETAIKFFERAIQVDSNCVYPYTLLGHEYVAIEELDKALKCYRTAIRIDSKHYNAWYGLGMIYYKQERYQRAETYYKKAIAVHPHNSVLLCHLGVVQHALNQPEKSLASFEKGLVKNPSDPLCKFHRASVLFALNRLDSALAELEELKYIVPKESLVYFLIAKIYSKKGDTHQALLHFSWATDLDPKGANNQIKESIEPVLSRSLSSAANLTELRESTERNETGNLTDTTGGDGGLNNTRGAESMEISSSQSDPETPYP